MNGEVVFMFVIAQLTNISINFIAGSDKIKHLDKVSASVKNVNKQNVFCALFTLSNNTTLGKIAIFCRIWFPQVVQKHTMGEVGNYIMMASCLRNILTKNY